VQPARAVSGPTRCQQFRDRRRSVPVVSSLPHAYSRQHVRVVSSGVSGLTSFRFSNILSIPPCPDTAAQESGVRPSLLAALGSTSFGSGSILTISSCSLLAAQAAAVLQWELVAWTAHFLSSIKQLLSPRIRNLRHSGGL